MQTARDPGRRDRGAGIPWVARSPRAATQGADTTAENQQGRPFGRSGFATALSTHLPGINPVQVRGACPDEADGMPSAVYRVQLPGAGQAHVMVFSVIEPGQTQPLASGFSFSRKYEHDWLCDHDHGPGSDHRH